MSMNVKLGGHTISSNDAMPSNVYDAPMESGGGMLAAGLVGATVGTGVAAGMAVNAPVQMVRKTAMGFGDVANAAMGRTTFETQGMTRKEILKKGLAGIGTVSHCTLG